MPLRATIAAVAIMASLFGWAVPLLRLFDAFQPIIVSLSILLAAVLVRLNRGMPTLDWKSLDVTGRQRLTTKIVEITKDYMIISFIYLIFIIFLIAITAYGKADLVSNTSNHVQVAICALSGGMIALSLCRMSYIIWRDFDVVRLQKKLIDESGVKEQYENDLKVSEGKISVIRASGLKRVGAPEVKPWE